MFYREDGVGIMGRDQGEGCQEYILQGKVQSIARSSEDHPSTASLLHNLTKGSLSMTVTANCRLTIDNSPTVVYDVPTSNQRIIYLG